MCAVLLCFFFLVCSQHSTPQVTGLQKAAVWRLKRTWAEVSKRRQGGVCWLAPSSFVRSRNTLCLRMEQWERVSRLADPQHNYAALRAEMSTSSLPRIAFVGCYLTILVFVRVVWECCAASRSHFC